MRRLQVLWVGLVTWLLVGAGPADAGPRQVALVIGNHSYRHATQLPQAGRDARSVARTLESLGFHVTVVRNADRERMRRALLAFGRDLRGSDVGFVYYAGHGLQFEGATYLVPVDARLDHEGLVPVEAVDAQWVLLEMARANARLNVVVLDASRTSPFSSRWVGEHRAVPARGLSPLAPPDGNFLLAFAAGPGQLAEDSGVYAGALVAQLREPCVDLPLAFARVHDAVLHETGRAQRPWVRDAAGVKARQFFPAGCPTQATGAVRPAPPREPQLVLEGGALRMSSGEPLHWVPGGTFRMGSLDQDASRDQDEGPAHMVTVEGFYVMRTEVTQSLWASVMGSQPSHFASCGGDCPVEQVSWRDAVAFANRLSEREGLTPAYDIGEDTITWDRGANGFRLLTEAEWEYAARGGEPYGYAGSEDGETVGWLRPNGGGRTHPVCGLPANGYGLCDMTGNVWEWVWDRYGRYASDTMADPAGPDQGDARVVRGGSWDGGLRSARVAYRLKHEPDSVFPDRGFRLGLSGF